MRHPIGYISLGDWVQMGMMIGFDWVHSGSTVPNPSGQSGRVRRPIGRHPAADPGIGAENSRDPIRGGGAPQAGASAAAACPVWIFRGSLANFFRSRFSRLIPSIFLTRDGLWDTFGLKSAVRKSLIGSRFYYSGTLGTLFHLSWQERKRGRKITVNQQLFRESFVPCALNQTKAYKTSVF